MRNAVTTEKAPVPVGPYSQAVIEGDLVFVAGQGPGNPATGQLELGDVRTQTTRVLQNMEAILQAAGSSLDRVIRCNVYLKDIADFAAMNEVYAKAFAVKDIADFAAMNEVYAKAFAAPYPARTTIQAGALPGGIAVEIECVARR